MACRHDSFQGFLYLFFCFIWAFYTLWWIYNTWVKHIRFTQSLQKFILVVLALRALNLGFCSGSVLYCESPQDEAYWGLAVTSTFTLYNTFVYTIFALISRGFCVTRNSLSRTQVTSIAVIMALVYLGYSAYLIDTEAVGPYLLVILGLVFFSAISNAIRNIRLLQHRYYTLHRSNIRQMLPQISSKLWTMKLFLVLCYIFFIEEALKVAFTCITLTIAADSKSSFSRVFFALSQLFLSISVLTSFWICRSRPTREDYDPAVLLFSEQHPAAPMLTAGLPDSLIPSSDAPALLICPQVLAMSKIHTGVNLRLLIATPIK